MGTGSTQQQQQLRWLVLFAAGVASAAAVAVAPAGGSASGSIQQDRSHAFIGYTEAAGTQIPAGYGRCSNQLDNCEHAAAMNGCLTDPFRLRRLCPISCLVEPCVNQGTVLRQHTFSGYATETGTGLYAKALAATVGANHFNRVTMGSSSGSSSSGGDGGSKPTYLYLSSLGTGTYLGASDDMTDEQVLSTILYAATRGWNVIDTASNYRNGRAEASIGRALSLLLMGNTGNEFPESRLEVTRDALFISSKAGYLTPELKQQLLSRRLVNATDLLGAGTHCLAPACIRASLASSLAKLRLQTLDLLYLHNAAEVQLQARGKEGFMEVLRAAFKELEALRSEGLIRSYGLATWDCFRTPHDSPLHLELADVVALAKEVGGEHTHGFMAVQAPINLKMSEAYTHKWQRVVNRTATDAAARAAQVAAEAAEQAQKAAAVAAAAAALAAAEEAGQPLPAASSPPPPPSTPPPPPLPRIIVHDHVSLVDAAVELGIQLFASAPLMEAQLLQGLVGPLEGVMQFKATADIRSTAGKLLQYVRSMPAVTSAIVGHKAKEHVESNVALAVVPQLTPRLWELVHSQMQGALTLQQQQRQQ